MKLLAMYRTCEYAFNLISGVGELERTKCFLCFPRVDAQLDAGVPLRPTHWLFGRISDPDLPDLDDSRQRRVKLVA